MRHLGSFLLIVLLAACSGAPPTPSPMPQPTPSPSPSPSQSPTPSPGASFYLRAWISQALPPADTFGWLPMVTIVEGTLIDGNVAVPAIYPGPLMITPFSRFISETGVAAIIDEARRLGMLGEATDFTGGEAMPGGRLGMIEIVVDGETRFLTGDPENLVPCDGARCDAEPGTPEAFAAYWQELVSANMWLEPELGPIVPYEPELVALLLTSRLPPNEPGLTPPPISWPFEPGLDEAGVPFPGSEGDRCLTLSGDDLAAVLPNLTAANQLTTFVDDEGNQRSPEVRVLVPGEESPCPDEG